MTDLKDTPHPTAMSDEAKAALIASDPAAFDAEPAGDAGAADDTAAKEAAAEQETADKAAAEAEEAKKSDMIPKGRLNEVLRERDAERERAEALAAELAALKNGPPVDYAEEIKKLDASWNSDGDDAFEGPHAEYLEKRDALLVQQAKADAKVEFAKEQAQRTAEEQLAAWDKAANAFIDKDERYKNPDEFARFNEALEIQFARNPQGTHDDWLQAAHKHVQALAIVEGRAQPETPKGPHDDRNKADATAAAKASSAPPILNGGVSSGGGPIGNVDVSKIKPGQFSKLTPEQQAAALGGADAL